MTRSPIWLTAFALAYRELRGAVRFTDVLDADGVLVEVRREPLTPAEIGAACAKEADACEAALLAAEGS